MTNASVRASIRTAEKAEAEAQQVRDSVVVALMSHSNGRQYVHTLLSDAHVFHDIPLTDPNQVFFMLGQRRQALDLFSDLLRLCPEQFIQMMREQNARDELARSRDERDADTEPELDLGGPDPGYDVYGRGPN